MAMLLVSLMSSFGGAGEVSYPLGHRVQRSVRRAAGDDVQQPSLPACFLQEAGPGRPGRSYRRLLQTSGRAPSDYLRMFGAAPVLINGVNGLIAMGVILLTGGGPEWAHSGGS